MPHTPFAISLNLNFWILPVLVFGMSANTTMRGHLHLVKTLCADPEYADVGDEDSGHSLLYIVEI
jgi:hypothetical protein